jgi:hypothetical protein
MKNLKNNRQSRLNLAINPLKRKSSTLQKIKGGLEMKEKPKADKPFLTDKELVDTLLLISETTKSLAQEVMLLPEDSDGNGGEEDVEKTNVPQPKV